MSTKPAQAHTFGLAIGLTYNCILHDTPSPRSVEFVTSSLTFYDFPDEHPVHLRTTNPIESTFATLKLRTANTRGCLSRKTALTMVFQGCRLAESHWLRINGPNRGAQIIEGVRFVDDVEYQAAA